MKLCAVVALFLIGTIPVKINYVYSLADFHWDAKGSRYPPNIAELLDKAPRTNLATKLPILISDIGSIPTEMDRHHLEVSGNYHDSSKHIINIIHFT